MESCLCIFGKQVQRASLQNAKQWAEAFATMVSENVRSDIRAIDEELVWLADVLDWNYCSIKALVKAETQNTAWTLYERVGASTSELSTILHEWETEEHFGFKAARVVEACTEMKVVAVRH